MNSPSDSPRRYEAVLNLNAPSDVVWKALTDASEIRQWFAPGAEFAPGIGGEVAWEWPDIHRWVQTVETWEPGRRLRTEYPSQVDDGEGGKKSLFIDFEIIAESGEETTLRVVHSGFGHEGGFDEEYEGISRGWPVELQSLRLYVERHAGQDRQLVWRHRAIHASADQAWTRLLGAEGLQVSENKWKTGDELTLNIEEFGEIRGQVLVALDHELVCQLPDHGDAFLRMTAEACGGTLRTWLWVALYGQPESRIKNWERALDRLVELERPAPVTTN